MGMNQRTRALLINQGVMTETGLTAKARHRHCKRGCGLVLLAGTWLGLEAWCDPWPITTKGELDALMAGRHTYTYSTLTLGLDFRGHHTIATKSPERYDVHAEHRCGQPHPDVNWLRVRAAKEGRTHEIPSTPPF